MGIFSNIIDEITYLRTALATEAMVKHFKDDSTVLFADEFENNCDKFGANVAIYYENKTITYSQLDFMANRYANWGKSIGLVAGDIVSLFMNNCPDYLACWIGMSKIGVVTALINNSILGSQLSYCVSIAKSKLIITEASLAPVWAEVCDTIPNIPVYVKGGTFEGFIDLDRHLNAQTNRRPSKLSRGGLFGKDPCLYVYTSGTTGYPKAARLSNNKAIGYTRVFMKATGVNEKDRVYITLPLYHATGGICAVGIALNSGAAIVLKNKFSASHFWDDIVHYKCTIFVYIGELFRYLVSLPVNANETQHSIKSCFGNGLRPEVWEKAEKRFGIPRIAEFYGSTEGMVFLLNFLGKKYAIGRIPKYLRWKYKYALVKFDIDTEMPVRDENGFCIKCNENEIGEMIGKVNPSDPRAFFEGYANDKASSDKKIIRNVFEEGDVYYRSGDLMHFDNEGYYYFDDRLGDTYRWKSENISTTNVSEALSGFKGIAEVNSYGVSIPNTEGRAGMAVIVASKSIDYDKLLIHLRRELPPAAIPIFLRRKESLETTATFKYKKVDLVKEGYNPELVSDDIYWLNPSTSQYQKLSAEDYNKILNSEIRF